MSFFSQSFLFFKFQQAEDLRERLAESEKLMARLTQSWEERLRETEEIHKVSSLKMVMRRLTCLQHRQRACIPQPVAFKIPLIGATMLFSFPFYGS